MFNLKIKIMKKTLLLAIVALFALCTNAQKTDVNSIINKQPEGKVKLFKRVQGVSFYKKKNERTNKYEIAKFDFSTMQNLNLEDRLFADLVVVFAPDGKTVYMKDPISFPNLSVWVKGEIKDGKLVFPLEQLLLYIPKSAKNPEMKFLTKLLEIKVNKKDNKKEYFVLDDKEITYAYDDDTILRMEGTSENKLYALMGNDESGWFWTGYGDYDYVYEYDEEATAGINSVKADSEKGNIVAETYYDLSGRQITNPQNGISIKKVEYSNGEQKVSKVLKR